jgi:hypothetical protein
MQKRLLTFGLSLAILGAFLWVAIMGIGIVLKVQARSIDRAQDALLEPRVPGERLVKESDGSIWVESRFRNRDGSGTMRTWDSILSSESMQLEERRSRLKASQLVWGPLWWIGTVPFAFGLLILAACWTLFRQTPSGASLEVDEGIVLTPVSPRKQI